MSDPTIMIMSELRHACRACGDCCRGQRIRLEDAEEIAKVEAQGVALGVADPVVDGALRAADGACVFLDTDQLCRIHKAYGLAEKPRVCQQYPVRVALNRDTSMLIVPSSSTGL